MYVYSKVLHFILRSSYVFTLFFLITKYIYTNYTLCDRKFKAENNTTLELDTNMNI